MTGARPVAGLLLTGGASRRMGTDKAALVVDGRPLAVRLADLLGAACGGPVLEVGPGRSGLPWLIEDPAGAGPLVAVAAGAAALRARGWHGAVLVLACDLPLLTPQALGLLATWPGDASVVPVVGGRSQPLCARWSAAGLAAAEERAAGGQRSLRGLPGPGTRRLAAAEWGAVDGAATFSDVDTPEDLAMLAVPGTE